MHALVKKAARLALKAHQLQQYGDKPYFYHLLDVFKLVSRICIREKVSKDTKYNLQAAAFLHDILEDQGWICNYHNLLVDFNKDVADIVYACTNEKGRSQLLPLCVSIVVA